MNLVLVFFILAVAGVGLDLVWIGLFMKKFYLEAFASFGRITDGEFKPIYWAAMLVYLLISAALCAFVVAPAGDEPWLDTVWKGALLGLCLYGVYDLTNLATVQAWTLRLSLVDVAWGTTLCAILGSLGRLLLARG